MPPRLVRPVMLEFTMGDGTTGEVMIDASVNEQHAVSAQVTEHQVEVGANITDNIRPMPRRISIEGVVTNTPIAVPLTQMRNVRGAFGVNETMVRRKVGDKVPLPGVQFAPPQDSVVKYQALLFDGEFDRVRDVFGVLVDAAMGVITDVFGNPLANVGAAVFRVTTTLATYDRMAIVNFAVPRNAATGNALNFTIDMQEIRTVETQEVAPLAGKHRDPPRAAKKQDRGVKPAKEVPQESVLSKTTTDKVSDFVSGVLRSFGVGG